MFSSCMHACAQERHASTNRLCSWAGQEASAAHTAPRCVRALVQPAHTSLRMISRTAQQVTAPAASSEELCAPLSLVLQQHTVVSDVCCNQPMQGPRETGLLPAPCNESITMQSQSLSKAARFVGLLLAWQRAVSCPVGISAGRDALLQLAGHVYCG
jgi:hypothetical protein